MEELQFGQFGLSAVLMAVVGIVYKMAGDSLSDRWKVLIMILIGLGLGVLAIPYQGLPWTVVNIVNCLLVGLMSAAAASGFYSWQSKARAGGGNTTAPVIAFLLLLSVSGLAGMTALNGCAANQAQQQAVEEPTEVKIYKALDISATAYDTAMRSLNDLYVNGVISKEAARKAWDGGEAFYLAQKGAIQALRVYVQGKSAASEQELNAAIGKAGEALAQFTSMVTPFLTRQLVTDLESAQGKLKGRK